MSLIANKFAKILTIKRFKFFFDVRELIVPVTDWPRGEFRIHIVKLINLFEFANRRNLILMVIN